MNPKEQECLGFFGYGNGYFSEESKRTVFGFCNQCAQQAECWRKHRVKAALAYPELQARFDYLFKLYGGNQVDYAGANVVKHMAKDNQAPADVTLMMDNMQLGIEDRLLEEENVC